LKSPCGKEFLWRDSEMSRTHVIITGTGRSGTTFLVELLTHLGLDTGFKPHEIESGINNEAQAGLEHNIRHEDSPYIVKSPHFCDYAEEILSRNDIVIEHVLIPIRDLYAAAESRRQVVKRHVLALPFYKRLMYVLKPQKVVGGLWHTRSRKMGIQEEVLLKQIYKLVLALSDRTIPVTFMHYPRIVKDCPYLFQKLKPILGQITSETFHATFKEVVRPKWVHTFGRNDY
jgi:hypothetical protein